MPKDPQDFNAISCAKRAACYYCNGTGSDPDGAEPKCPICDGSGERAVLHY